MDKYENQFKTTEDLYKLIKEYEPLLARPVRRLSHPTLYRSRDVKRGDILLQGVRQNDWLFSADLQWVLPHNQMGLSFSAQYQHLKGIYKMKEKHNPGAKIDVYWVLESADLPPDMKFEPDQNKKGHYFLTVTQRMTLPQLITRLKWVADRMSVMRDCRGLA